MIHIEKLSSESTRMYNWENFCDFLIPGQTNKFQSSTNHNKWIETKFITSEYFSNSVFKKFPNVLIGKHFGTIGMDLDLLLLGHINIDNLVVEMSAECLKAMPRKKLKLLLETYPVILNDFMEFGTLYGMDQPHLVTFLNNLNIKPKQLFLVGGGFQLHDYPQLNIFKIQFEFWTVVTVLLDEFFSNAVFNSKYKEQQLAKLENTPTKFCLAPIYKPRYKRVELLALLDNLNILEKCDWSLALNSSPRVDSYAENAIEDFSPFIQKYQFPRELTSTEKYNTLQKPQTDWFNRYKFYVSAETYIGDEMDMIMGGCSSITEKTIKSFLIGASPIILGGTGSLDHLDKMGFKTQFGNYDTTSTSDISKLLLEINDNPIYDAKLIQHNFNRITDLEFLIELFCQPISQISTILNNNQR